MRVKVPRIVKDAGGSITKAYRMSLIDKIHKFSGDNSRAHSWEWNRPITLTFKSPSNCCKYQYCHDCHSFRFQEVELHLKQTVRQSTVVTCVYKFLRLSAHVVLMWHLCCMYKVFCADLRRQIGNYMYV